MFEWVPYYSWIHPQFIILLMEIHTSGLLDLSLHSLRLEKNFEYIAGVLKQLQQQLSSLALQQQTLATSETHTHQLIQDLRSQGQQQQALLEQHQSWLDQLNSQFGLCDPPLPEEEQADGARTSEHLQKRISQQGGSKVPASQAGKGGQKKGMGLQEMLGSIQERLRILQRESEHKDVEITQLGKAIPKGNTQRQKRGSVVSKELSSKNKMSRKELRQPTISQQLKEEAGEGSEGSLPEEKTVPSEDRPEEEALRAERARMEEAVGRVRGEVERMRGEAEERNRVLDAHLKESQQKIQSLQRDLDILERSHDMLKFDFEKASPPSAGKCPVGERRRQEEGLSETRVSNREYYEEKLVELFNDMEFLKGEYFDLQARLEKETEDEPEEDRNCRKARIAQKLTAGQKEEGKGELGLQRQELRRLRQEFEAFALGVNSGEVRTVLIKANENKEDWKSLSTKMQRLRAEVSGAVRELEGKIVASNEMVVEFGQVGVAIEECKLLLKRKVEQADFEKTAKRLEGKLNHFIMQVFEKQGQEGEFDAALARQPWFCLSCDSELKNYSGKNPKGPLLPDKLAGRKVNTESHMVRRNENGRLPSVVK